MEIEVASQLRVARTSAGAAVLLQALKEVQAHEVIFVFFPLTKVGRTV